MAPSGLFDIRSDQAPLIRELLKQHVAASSNYRQSRNEATKRIDTEMKRYRPAFAFPNELETHEGTLLENQLAAASICPQLATRVILTETACRFIPYGCVTAKTYEYAPGKSYIILDTGVGDFYGNVAALTYALFQQEHSHSDYGLDEQTIISHLWCLALIFHDHGFKTNNEALVLPHFKFGKLDADAVPFAATLAHSAIRFFLFHEFGHIVDRTNGNITGTHEDEFSSDFFALTAMRESALHHAAPSIEFIIIGCLMALAAIDFIESTFPGLSYTRDGKQLVFPHPLPTYPSAKSRLERLLSHFPLRARQNVTSNPYYKTMRNMFREYSEIIKGGGAPSNSYRDHLDDRLQAHKEGKTTATSSTQNARILSLDTKIRKLCKLLAEEIGDKYTGPMMWNGAQVWPVRFTCENGTYTIERTSEGLVVKAADGKQVAVVSE